MFPKPGDWQCSCSELNFASRTACRKCAKPKPQAAASALKPGDWICSQCNELNFASRAACRKCNAEKSGSTTTVLKKGDWTCPNQSCKEVNFASRNVCRKCNTPKPSNQPSSSSSSNPSSSSTSSNVTNNSESTECIVCLENPADTIITACGHLGLCGECAKRLHECPVCRTSFVPSQLLKVFKV